MALQIGTSLTGANAVYDLNTLDDIFVVENATIIATAGSAIIGVDSGHSATVLGAVFATFAGVDLGSGDADSGNVVYIGATGSVQADPSTSSVAVRIFGTDGHVTNEGLIRGGNGIVFSAAAGGTLSVDNYGTISAELNGVRRFGGTTGTILVNNSGLIIGKSASVSANSTTAIEEVHNRGRIVGLLELAGGEDIVDNRRGVIEGDVDFGADNDTFDNLDGVLLGTALGGAGNDTFRLGAGIEFVDGGADLDAIDFRGAPAVQASLDGSVEGTGNAAGDEYMAVEAIYGSYYADLLVGSATANTLRGYGGNDVMNGGAGGDKLVGGNGIDTITGGNGSDTFVYDKLSEIGDLIADFGSSTGNHDLFNIRASGFGGGLVAGTLGAALFQSRADNAAQDADDRFIFRTTDRTLWFDVDGNGAGAAVMVADMQAGATVVANDIVVI